MKRLPLLLSFLFIAVTLSAQEWKTLAKDDFTIDYPADWEINETGFMGTTFGLFSPLGSTGDFFRENVNLIEQDLAGMEMTLDEYAVLSVSQIKSFITNANITSNERVNDHQKVIYDGDQGQFSLTFEQYYWIQNNKAYILTLTCERKEFEAYQQIGEQILNSFILK